ncbi:hypothetical protein Goklo_029116, partial [Gossypium klotzschianum]|nr:hypothetical protein [Gossypium klotzschianum]
KTSISSSTTHPQFLRFKPIDANLTTRSDPSATGDSSCDYSDGSWVYDPNAGFDRYDKIPTLVLPHLSVSKLVNLKQIRP